MIEFKFKVKTNLTTIYKHYRIPQDQSKMDNPEKLGTQDEEKQNTTQHNMYWTPQYAKYSVFLQMVNIAFYCYIKLSSNKV